MYLLLQLCNIVSLIGSNASSIRGELNNMMKKGDQKLGAYRESVICCSCKYIFVKFFLMKKKTVE